MKRYVLALVALTLMSVNIQAKEIRAESWEFFFTPQFIQSKTLEFGHGAEADINSRSAIGFGFGYNLDAHIELTMLFSASSGNYRGTRVKENGVKEKFSSNMYTNSMNIAATYNFIEGPLTPYVSATMGMTYVDSGIVMEDSPEYCWWDPWWGHQCRSRTYTDTVFNYGASVGVRYDFGNRLYLKGGVGTSYVDYDTTNSSDFIIYDFAIGSTF